MKLLVWNPQRNVEFYRVRNLQGDRFTAVRGDLDELAVNIDELPVPFASTQEMVDNEYTKCIGDEAGKAEQVCGVWVLE